VGCSDCRSWLPLPGRRCLGGTPARGEQQVNTTATDLYFDPSVATSHEGHFVVTWDTEDDYDYGGYRRARLFEELL